MDSVPPIPSTPATSLAAQRTLVVLLMLAVISYAGLLRHYTAPYAGGSDSSGYLNSAALLRAGRLSAPKPFVTDHGIDEFGAEAHVPLGFITRRGTGEMVPTYPIGLPLHLAAFSWPVGLDWATIPLNICTALAGGGLLYLLARRLDLPAGWALAATAVLLVCPLYLFSAIQPMSDLLAMTWSLAALYAALRADRRPGWALFCGVAVAWAVLVRPTCLLLTVPIVLALGSAWRSYLWVGLGGLPGAILLAAYNRYVYGSPFATGYGDIWGTLFKWEFFGHNLPFFARWIPGLLSPVAVVALAAPFLTPRRRELAVLGSWAATLIVFYAFYYHSGETWWYLRFILPAFPVLILSAAVTLHSVLASTTGRRLVAGALLVVALGWELAQVHRFQLIHNKSGDATYYDAAQWARAHLPGNAIIVCMQVSGAFHYYTRFLLVRWEQIMPTAVPPLWRAVRAQQRPVYAVLFDFEEIDARQRMGGQWNKITQVRQAGIWRIEPDAP